MQIGGEGFNITKFELVNMFGELSTKYPIDNDTLSCDMFAYGYIEGCYEFKGKEIDVTIDNFEVSNLDGEDVDYVSLLNDSAAEIVLKQIGKFALIGL